MVRLVVSYNLPTDPPATELAAIERQLAGLRVVDRMPGSFLIEGSLRDVQQRLASPDGRWTASPVQQLHSNPPHRAKKLKG